jgi:hypothetical protein
MKHRTLRSVNSWINPGFSGINNGTQANFNEKD